MIRLLQRTSLLVAFSLLTSAATAYAECAWVLWQESITVLRGEKFDPERFSYWSIVDAFSTREGCQGAMPAEQQKLKASVDEAKEKIGLHQNL